MPKQLKAIKHSWNNLKVPYKFNFDLKELNGLITSHQYIGYDVPIDINTPIVSNSNLFESLSEATQVKEIYLGCKEIDDIYPNIKFVSRDFKIKYADFHFKFQIEALDPSFEIEFIKSYRKQILKSIQIEEPKRFDNIEELAKAYLEKLES
ncbi:hypothetical protein [Sinanaerobacter sp. ZZT-01]|uniref:hypothetical protein n=1 Tax=Sinanaerobacter sp. ZZT-01 TaxID=3111540 RepID=UPI002D776F81|nr:hypothetical protein [Sinanaerobacter sp. ZZT-01]WRR93952.1 hypothetical protein U5921_02180 [Sinanaerobacter sp. ZZT-01]